MHEGDRALAGRIGDPFERGFDERAARGPSRGEIGGELGKRREGREFGGHDVVRSGWTVAEAASLA